MTTVDDRSDQREHAPPRRRTVVRDRLAPVPSDPAGQPPLEHVPGMSGWAYVPGLGVWRLGKADAPPRRVLPWCPAVLERLAVVGDDGQATGRYYTVRAGTDEQVVSHRDLVSGEAWERFPDAIGTGSRSTREALLNIITAEAAKLTRTKVVGRTGWHSLSDGRRAYVYPDGRTYPPGEPVRIVGVAERTAAAARPLAVAASDRDVRAALEQLAAIGAPSLLAVGAAARSLGYSLRPAPTSLVLVGEPGSGKSGCAALARMLVFDASWPPAVTASFADTVTRIEAHVNREADVPVLIEDLALAADASELETREANAKLERILRAAGNQTEMRGRMTRDLFDKPGNYVRSLPLVTAQQLPRTMQVSLYRRCIVVHLEPGEVDTRWLREHAGELWPPLRAVGDRIVARLARDDAAELLRDLDAEAAHRFGRQLDQTMPARSDVAHGIALLAAHPLAGLLLAADVAGIDRDVLAGPAVDRGADALGQQLGRMEDRRAVSDSLAEAVGDVVRAAMFARRAHVRDADDDPAPAVPGQTPQAQGLRAPRSSSFDGDAASWEGEGAAFYWLPDHGALGVRSAELHTLLGQSRDRRAQGYTVRSLPPALLRAGALVPSAQQDRAGSWLVRIGDAPRRLLLLRAEAVYPDDDRTPPAQRTVTTVTTVTAQVDGSPAEPAPEGGTLASNALTSAVTDVTVVTDPGEEGSPTAFEWHWERTPVGPCVVCGGPCHTLGPDGRPVHPIGCWGKPARSTATDPAALQAALELDGSETATRRPAEAVPGGGGQDGPERPPAAQERPPAGLPEPARGRFRVRPRPVRLAALDLAGLWTPEGLARPGFRPADAAELLDVAAELDAEQVWLHPAAIEALGLPTPRHREDAEAHPFIAASLERFRYFPEGLAPWVVASPLREGKRAGAGVEVALAFVDGADDHPLQAFAALPDGPALLRAAELFRGRVGVPFRSSPGATARDLWLALRKGRTSLRPGEAVPPTVVRPSPEAPFVWSRPLSDAERGHGWVHAFDANAQYLGTAASIDLGAGQPEHRTGPLDFDRKTVGYWLAEVPPAPSEFPPDWGAHAPAELLPDPFTPSPRLAGMTDPAGRRWATTPTLALAAELGAPVWVAEAWVWPQSRRFLRPWAETFRDARAACQDDPSPEARAVLAAVKLAYNKFFGWLASEQVGGELARPDWHQLVIAQSRVNLYRKLARLERPPFAVDVDALYLTAPTADPAAACPAGLQLGPGLGQFKHAGTAPAAVLEGIDLASGRAAHRVRDAIERETDA
jgi:hypothetical protein